MSCTHTDYFKLKQYFVIGFVAVCPARLTDRMGHPSRRPDAKFIHPYTRPPAGWVGRQMSHAARGGGRVAVEDHREAAH